MSKISVMEYNSNLKSSKKLLMDAFNIFAIYLGFTMICVDRIHLLAFPCDIFGQLFCFDRIFH